MKIKQISLTKEAQEKRDYRNAMKILIDDKVVFEIADGEAEDMYLFRDLGACWGIPGLLQQAYEAGKAGESIEIIKEEVDSESYLTY